MGSCASNTGLTNINSKIDNLIKTKPYSVTPDANSNVSPFSFYKEIAIDVTYTTILGVKIVGGNSTNPSVAKINSTGSAIWYYSAKNNAVTVELIYI